MTLGIESGYGMMGGMNPMMSRMYPMAGGISPTFEGGMNVPQYFTQKYGCADCFRGKPYIPEFPKPVMPLKTPPKACSLLKQLFSGLF